MEQLERYSGAVAGSVGQCVIAILGLRDPDSRERAERLGIAMQLTNVLRDVREDWERGRQYVPVVAYGEAALPDVMRALAAQARALYAESSVLAARLPNDGSRAAVLTASALYARILERLERRHYDPAGGRVSVGTVTKVRVALRCALAAHTGFATIK
jgi:phytoene synthase